MPDAIITSTESTFGTISGTFAADQSTVTGTISGIITGTLDGSVGVPGPQGPTGSQGPQGPQGPQGEPGQGVPAGGTAGQFLQKIDGVDYNTDWVTLNLSAYAPLNSPLFTGDPRGPTAALGDNDTSLATTAFVQQELASGVAVAKNLEVLVRNQSGSTIAAGAIVYISGATGNKPLITLAQANNDANSAQTMGFVKTAIADNGTGYVIVRGEVENLDTSALTEGAQLYLSPTTAGAWTTTKPSAPQHLVYVGIVIRSHPTQGIILVAVQNGYELNELHDVAISSPTNGQVLKYDSATNLWKNQTDLNSGVWGSITGTLSSQTDLQSALDGKYSTTNPAGYITSAALSGYAPLNSPTFTGTPSLPTGTTAVTQSPLDSSTAIATTQFLQNELVPYLTIVGAEGLYYPLTGNPSGFLTSAPVTSVAGKTGAVSLAVTDISGAAPLASPLFTGDPRAPTPATSDNDTSIATTAFVKAQGYITSAALSGYATESWVTSQGYLTDAPSDGTIYGRQNNAWVATGGGSSYITSVTSPLTVTSGDLSIDLTGYATESWVSSQGYITSVNFFPLSQDLGFDTSSAEGRLLVDGVYDPTSSGFTSSRINIGSTLPSSPLNGDFWSNGSKFRYTLGGTTYDIASESWVSGTLTSYAPKASPALTGVPTAPTASLGTNTTQIATTAFVIANAGGGGGGGVDVQTFGGPSSSGSFTWTKPAGAKFVQVYLWGAGAGGARGARQATTVARFGGNGGGGANFLYAMVSADEFSSTVSGSIGSGGSGAVAATADNSNALTGSDGQSTTFNFLKANGGRASGAARTSSINGAQIVNGLGGTGSTGNGGFASNSLIYYLPTGGGGGPGGGASSTLTRPGTGGGAFLPNADTAGANTSIAGGSGGTTGGIPATDGVSTTSGYLRGGTGGGSGAYFTGVAGGNGANGGWPGGGGGGGSASDNGFASGAGGNGANGYAVIITYT